MAIEIRARYWQGRRHYVITGATLVNCTALMRWVGASPLVTSQTGESTKSDVQLWLDLVSNRRVAEVDAYVVKFFVQHDPQVNLTES